ncbi:hypothetical protein FQA39_LY12383 [Lamprigera yunnana]|nr:hypothetical protein FQA39_LY12383 [Lamprigera yunnana]
MRITENEMQMIEKEISRPKLYKRRWAMLFMFFISCPFSTVQWSQYIIVADIIRVYYNVSFEAVNWTSMIFSLLFAILVFPSSYIVDKYGIKLAILIGNFGTCVATWIKVGSIAPNRFWIIILAQTIAAASQVLLFSVPVKLAANWFGSNEVSTACAIGFSSIMVGSALGFVLPPLLIKAETIEHDLFITSLVLAILCTIVFFLTLLFMQNKPPIPPSYAMLQKSSHVYYLETAKMLLKNWPYLIITLGIALNMGINTALETLLNQVVLKYHPGAAEDVGWIGLLMVVVGIFGGLFGGYILDKFKIYQVFAVILSACSFATILIFTCTIRTNIVFLYVTYALIGFCFNAFWFLGFQIVAEVTYPEPEAITLGIVKATGQALSIGVTYIYSAIFYNVNDRFANILLLVLTAILFLIMTFTPFHLKRQAAELEKTLDQASVGFENSKL